jgi:hypothetical protein
VLVLSISSRAGAVSIGTYRLSVLILAGTILDWAKCEVGTRGKQSEAYLIRNAC